MEEEKIDFIDPRGVSALILSIISDVCVIFPVIALVFPVIGVFAGALWLILHYGTGVVLFFLIFSRLEHLLPKIIFLIGIILPLPTLGLAVVLAVILQNRLIEQAFIQTAALAAAALTIEAGGAGGAAVEGAAAGAGAGAAGAAVGAGAAEGAAAGAAEAAGAGSEAAVEGGAAGAGAEGEGAAAAEAPKPEIPEEKFGMPEEPLEKIQKILQNLPEEEEPEEEEEDENHPAARRTQSPNDFL